MMWGVGGLLLVALVGCGGVEGDAPQPPASLELEATARQLRDVPRVPVEGFSGPGGKIFAVHVREGEIAQFPCGTCHQTALEPVPPGEVARRWSHADIQPVHPQRASCNSCHNYDDLQTLRLNDGSTVGFDHAYRLCAQCHFEQARDWAGGAHGKRMGGWRGERVVFNCTDCHDPHDPAFAPRMPDAGPRVPRTGASH